MTITNADVEQAAARLSAHLSPTPLLTSTELDDRCGARVLLKAEHMQMTGSFKIRGALNNVLAGQADGDDRGLITISSRNHARAVARAARIAGVPATIIMLRDASPLARTAAERDGATIVAENITKFNRESVGDRVLLEEDLRWCHPFEGDAVLAGQGTVGKELLDSTGQAPDIVVVPVGGGGLISGIAVTLRERAPSTRIIGVEPELADDARQSLAGGRIVVLPEQPEMLADTVDNMHIGASAFAIMREHVDAIVTVSEDEIAAAMWALWLHGHQLVEPAGALALAPLLSGALSEWLPSASGRAPTVACVLSGSNVDLPAAAQILDPQRSQYLSGAAAGLI